jgi:hypothetical protein
MSGVEPSKLASQMLVVANAYSVGTALRELTGAVSMAEIDRATIEDDALRLCAELRTFSAAMWTPDDEPGLYRCLAIVWLELRFEWQRHNLVASYDTAHSGNTELSVLVRESVATYMLQRIEMLLEREQLEALVSTAMEIIDHLRRDVSQVCSRIAA